MSQKKIIKWTNTSSWWYILGYLTLIMNRDFNQGKWTSEEDEALKQAASVHSARNWNLIAEFVGSRSAVQCSHRWNKILKPGVKKGPWTLAEDHTLTQWVEENGPIRWSTCAKLIEGRTGKQCRERWVNTLSPAVVKGNWSKEDDEFIIRMHKEHGPQWTIIAAQLPGRTENSVKNRFNSMIRTIERIRTKGDRTAKEKTATQSWTV